MGSSAISPAQFKSGDIRPQNDSLTALVGLHSRAESAALKAELAQQPKLKTLFALEEKARHGEMADLTEEYLTGALRGFTADEVSFVTRRLKDIFHPSETEVEVSKDRIAYLQERKAGLQLELSQVATALENAEGDLGVLEKRAAKTTGPERERVEGLLGQIQESAPQESMFRQ